MTIYLLYSSVVVPVAAIYEAWCRVLDRKARHSSRYRPPGRHRAARRDGSLIPEEAT
jgi:hypothetical protein